MTALEINSKNQFNLNVQHLGFHFFSKTLFDYKKIEKIFLTMNNGLTASKINGDSDSITFAGRLSSVSANGLDDCTLICQGSLGRFAIIWTGINNKDFPPILCNYSDGFANKYIDLCNKEIFNDLPPIHRIGVFGGLVLGVKNIEEGFLFLQNKLSNLTHLNHSIHKDFLYRLNTITTAKIKDEENVTINRTATWATYKFNSGNPIDPIEKEFVCLNFDINTDYNRILKLINSEMIDSVRKLICYIYDIVNKGDNL